MEHDPVSGQSSSELLTSTSPRSSSSRTSVAAEADGSRPSARISSGWDTYPLPSRFLPEPSELRTNALAPSSLPTPTASSYGSSNNGNPHDHREQYATRGKASLWTMASRGELPGHRRGHLSPIYAEWMMGFPKGWTLLPTGQTGFAF
jgi:hypothetical protein